MNHLISTSSLLFLADAQSSLWRSTWCATPPTCNQNGQYIKHPCDCMKYYFCSNGEAVLRTCGPGTYWDQSRRVCDFQSSVQCVIEEEPTTTVEPVTTVEPTESTTESNEIDCAAAPVCTTNGDYIRHPCDCQKYYMCSNGEAFLNSCGPGTNFESNGNFCNFINAVDCSYLDPETTESPTTQEMTTEELSCTSEFTSQLIKPDQTIRLFGHSNENFCLLKKYNDYNEGDEVWFGPCQVTSERQTRSLKYQWEHVVSTKQIKSVGAQETAGLNLCWSIESLEEFTKQRILLKTCDSADVTQKFVVIDGRIHSDTESRLCVGVDEENMDATNGGAIVSNNCWSNTFGNACGDFGDPVDSSVRVSNIDNLCWHKRYMFYQPGHTVFVKSCDVENDNHHKAGKYKFSYDTTSKQIVAEGSKIKHETFCLTVSEENRVKRQRMRIGVCDSSDQKQKFEYVGGRVYSVLNPNSCAGFEYHRYRDGLASVPLVFYQCFPNTFALDVIE